MAITLSKAVRSNLLNLQSTAIQMTKTQERLSSGNKVNSALDNPTNFFTAQALNSRASDLGALMDSVSNAVQTIAAADKGISAITKLVESAQSTARQAQQAALTAEGDGKVGQLNGTAAISVTGFTTGAAPNTSIMGDVTLTVNAQDVVVKSTDTADSIVEKFEAAAKASKGTANEFSVSYSATTGLKIQAKNDEGTLSITGVGSVGTFTGTGTAMTAAASLTAVQVALGLQVNGAGAVATISATATVADATVDRTDAIIANPKREELREQYNSLLDQIDQLAADSGFNGVNLLAGDDLEVTFNEAGSSKLDIAGVDLDSTGLGLTAVAEEGFNANEDIATTLTSLKTAIDDLRTKASTFGSNLSVVETRQNFTKDMINVLQTGAANLTLADTNEEAANLLALQTRQQLSSTALSMASQADQAVLRLF